MSKQAITITLLPTQVQAIANALRHNTVECEHSLASGVRRGCGACRALDLRLRHTAPKEDRSDAKRTV